VCEAELSDDKREKLIEAKRAEISSLDGKLEDLRAKRESEAKRLRELEEASKRLMELEARIENIEELRGELKKSKRVVGELNQAISELEDKLKGVETDVKRLQGLEESKREEERKLEMLRLHLQDLKEKRSRLAELNDQRKKVGERIGELEGQIVGKDVEKLEEELRQTLESKSLIKGELEGVERLVEEKIKRASELEQQLDSVLKLRQEVEKLDGLIKQLKIFSQALQATQVELREEFIQTVNHTMRQIWPTLYPYKDFVGIRLSIQEGDYVLQLQTRDGSWVDVEGMASGGERSIACLALRVAFSLVLVPHLQYLILDEPTVNLDATAINQLATVLRERVSNFVRQAFVITHQKELEESATGSLYKLERDKMEDGATKVVHIA
jgi:DNA repair exonuclease SbcCD ATPase subunit